MPEGSNSVAGGEPVGTTTGEGKGVESIEGEEEEGSMWASSIKMSEMSENE